MKLNALTDLLPTVLLRIVDILRVVCKSRHFSKLDVRAGFHNQRMHPDSVAKTAILFPGKGIYSWNVMPFGLCGPPGAFQAITQDPCVTVSMQEGCIPRRRHACPRRHEGRARSDFPSLSSPAWNKRSSTSRPRNAIWTLPTETSSDTASTTVPSLPCAQMFRESSTSPPSPRCNGNGSMA